MSNAKKGHNKTGRAKVVTPKRRAFGNFQGLETSEFFLIKKASN